MDVVYKIETSFPETRVLLPSSGKKCHLRHKMKQPKRRNIACSCFGGSSRDCDTEGSCNGGKDDGLSSCGKHDGSGRRNDDKDEGNFDFNFPIHEYVTLSTRKSTGKIYQGASASISTWQPSVEHEEEMSVAQIWVSTEYAGHYNGDFLQASWENDSYNRVNCINTQCHDTFITTTDDRPLGQPMNASVIDGPQMEELFQFQMTPSGDWHLNVGGQHVGYWPARVLPRLSRGASHIRCGGQVMTFRRGRHTKTQMGSGRFAGEGAKKAAYISQIRYMEGGSLSFVEVDCDNLRTLEHNPNCYSFMVQCDKTPIDFFYGGPGYGPNCLKPAE